MWSRVDQNSEFNIILGASETQITEEIKDSE